MRRKEAHSRQINSTLIVELYGGYISVNGLLIFFGFEVEVNLEFMLGGFLVYTYNWTSRRGRLCPTSGGYRLHFVLH